MIRLSAYYPNKPDARFDFAYYTTKHLELFRDRLRGAGIVSVLVERGLGGMAPGAPAPNVCVFHALIRDAERFAALMAEHAPELVADTPNFTNVEPIVQIGEVVEGGATIGKDGDVLTVVFEFDVEPDQQKPLREGIQDLVEHLVSRQPGFVSANLHLSRDGRKVLNYFQWESQEAFDAFRADAEKQAKIKPVIGPYGPKPRVYDVVYSATRRG